jgi:hypothetical protein
MLAVPSGSWLNSPSRNHWSRRNWCSPGSQKIEGSFQDHGFAEAIAATSRWFASCM